MNPPSEARKDFSKRIDIQEPWLVYRWQDVYSHIRGKVHKTVDTTVQVASRRMIDLQRVKDSANWDKAIRKKDCKMPTKHCTKCNDTGWYIYDEIYTKNCERCCKHDQGWWEITPSHVGHVYGKDNHCCAAGCGMMRRNLETK